MTSSSSFRLSVSQGGALLGVVEASEHALGASAVAVKEADARRNLEIAVTRPEGSADQGRVLLGTGVELVLPPGSSRAQSTVTSLREEFGEALFVYEEADPEDPASARSILELAVRLRSAPGIRELYEGLIQDLERIHVGLAQDIVGRTFHRYGVRRGAAAPVHPEEEVGRLARLHLQLEAALRRIGNQPSQAMARESRWDRWRPGDHVRASNAGEILRDRETVVVGGRLRSVGRVVVTRARMTSDIAEHRHLREGLQRLRIRARSIARHCSRAAETFEEDARRWSAGQRGGGSIYEQQNLPRIRKLKDLEGKADLLEQRFDQLLGSYDFVQGAGPARSRLAPSPIFLNRPGYREAFHALLEAARHSGPLVAGEEIGIHYRSLSKLYEYWCFVKVVDLMRKRLGPPEGLSSFTFVDDIYRPELEPGQSFRFSRGGRGSATVTYEPDIPPARHRGEAHTPLRAALSTAPLRPDIVVELEEPDAPPCILILDAKSSVHFDRKRLWDATDYRTRVFDPRTGHQPVRQVFFLHRDTTAAPLESLPGYLDGSLGDRSSSVLGAVAFLPERLEAVRRLIERFLAL